jgi:hypothetical protein
MLRRTSIVLFVLALTTVFAAPRVGWAAVKLAKRLNPTCDIYRSEFFGYYPTCWRRFPPQPPCPAACSAALENLPEPKPEGKPETKPEAPPAKPEPKKLPEPELKPAPLKK